MTADHHHTKGAPVKARERYIILDALRGFALLGICLANFPEFSLYTFLGPEAVRSMPTAEADNVARYIQYLLIDGKFYTLFSLLFGIGFSIIISNAARKGADGFRIFYRRMAILLLIGFIHLMFIWSGDILMLYAFLGFFLPLFRNVSDRGLLGTAAVLLVLPVAIDLVISLTGVSPSAWVVAAQQEQCARYGITEDNFAYWLRDADSYRQVFGFLVQGALVRVQEFIDGNRAFKVMGLFLIGFYLGRNRFYARLEEKRATVRRVFLWGLAAGLPLSGLYAWSAMNGHPWGLAAHTLLYTVSVYPTGFAYAAGLALYSLHRKESRVLKLLSAPGRMALTDYIGQSLCGMFIFYGTGLALGADMGLVYVLLTALCVYAAEVAFSHVWMRFCSFGPLEWIWRMLTYGERLPLLRRRS